MADELIVSTVQKQLNAILLRVENARIRLIKGVNREVQKFKSNILAVQVVLEDAENKLVRSKSAAVRDWLLKVKSTFDDIDDALDEWNTATQKLQMKEFDDLNASKPLSKVCYSSIIPSYKLVVLQGDLTLKLKDFYKMLDVIVIEKEKFDFKLREGTKELESTMINSVKIRELFWGRDEEKGKIVDLLLNESIQSPTTSIISIIGSEGIGKTTLARHVFNCKEVKNHFDERIWVSVYNLCDEIGVAKVIIQSIKDDASNLVELETIVQHIRQHIKGKKFLLVLDDVETRCFKNWKQLNYALKYGSRESRILMTTHEQEVAVKGVGISKVISLEPLSEKNSWSLFNKFAFFKWTAEEYKSFEETGKILVGKCKGLPLAIKILGNLLHFKKNIEEWHKILNNEMWEPGNDGEFLSPLLLSYYDLPFALKKCFSYCAIFPKNYEIEKNRLIKLWMSQNYLKVEGREDLELIGEEYFNLLAMRSFFQDFQENEYDGSIKSCKMHDMVHDFAKFLADNDNDFGGKSELKHLMLIFEGEKSFPKHVYDKNRKLRSLVVERRGGFMSDIDLSMLFKQLTNLRALDLSKQDNAWFNLIKKVPRGIKMLIHLRYLNLSCNQKIKELPETLCTLYNLQTLDLGWCTNLKNLPQGMGKFINLRHLVNNGTSVSYMPKGIQRLTSLRTLREFVVSHGNDGRKACALGCLENLSQLQCLSIKKLGNVTDEDGVDKAKLSNKTRLRDLYLNFQKDEEKATMDKDVENILLKLQLPPNLWRLEISYYRGKSISFNSLLSEVRSMSLEHCKNVEQLPPLGGLRCLESLVIRSMKSVKRVDNKFLEINPSYTPIIAFPSLKYLEFRNMNEWKEWNYKMAKKEEKIMPHLSSLIIGVCPKLETLPDYIFQAEVKVISCSKLEEIYAKRTDHIKFYQEY